MAGHHKLEEVIAGIEVVNRLRNYIRTAYKVVELVKCSTLSCRLLGIKIFPNNLDKKKDWKLFN